MKDKKGEEGRKKEKTLDKLTDIMKLIGAKKCWTGEEMQAFDTKIPMHLPQKA